MIVKSFGFLLFFVMLSAGARAEDAFYLHDGDRVLFFGDSITEQRHWTAAVENYVVTRFPKLNVRFVEAGWAGETAGGYIAGGIDVRLKRDVFPHKPTVVVAMFGMNDGYYYQYDEKIEKLFADNLTAMVHKLREQLPDIRITLLQTSPFDNVTRPSEDDWEKVIDGGYNAVLVRYGAQIPKLAEREHLLSANPNAALVDVLTKAREKNAKRATQIIPDRIHPGPAAGLIVAETLLKAWHAPAIVSSVDIDEQRNAKAENATVTAVKLEGETLSWMQTDAALPFPLDQKDATVQMVLDSSDFQSGLDRQPLRVAGIKSGKYELRIDGQKVATLTSKELADGIDLASLPTPMQKQSAEVAEATQQRSELAMARWRQVQVPFEQDHATEAHAAMTAMDRLEDVAIARQRAAAGPKPRKYEVAPSE